MGGGLVCECDERGIFQCPIHNPNDSSETADLLDEDDVERQESDTCDSDEGCGDDRAPFGEPVQVEMEVSDDARETVDLLDQKTRLVDVDSDYTKIPDDAELTCGTCGESLEDCTCEGTQPIDYDAQQEYTGSFEVQVDNARTAFFMGYLLGSAEGEHQEPDRSQEPASQRPDLSEEPHQHLPGE